MGIMLLSTCINDVIMEIHASALVYVYFLYEPLPIRLQYEKLS